MGSRPRRPAPRILIVGSGFAGLGLAIGLVRAGIRSFEILEKAEGIGGTWRDNVYPGAACDSPSFAYCFSFEQKRDWSRKWARQPEILAYLEHCATKYGLWPHIHLGTEVTEARFDEGASLWRVRSADGEERQAEILVSGVGQLNRPSIPPLPGLEDFAGPWLHSARWRRDVPLDDREVAVIGNAASAIQFVPKIAPRVGRLHLFQRTPNWMLPQNDRPYSEAEKERFRRHPWLAVLYRWWIWLSFELRWPIFRKNRFLSRRVEGYARRHMEAQVPDPALREVLVPDYPIGGKRILISDHYYPTLERPNVELVTTRIERIVPDGVRTRDGALHPAEVLILATGFETTRFLAPMKIQGRNGRWLQDAWEDGAEAYLGMTVAGFPNFFTMYGPNTNLGHNSIVFMIECQIRYILDCLRQMRERGLQWIDVRPEAQSAYNARLQERLAQTAWADTERSWYKNAAGRITNNWAGSTVEYWWRTRRADLGAYQTHP